MRGLLLLLVVTLALSLAAAEQLDTNNTSLSAWGDAGGDLWLHAGSEDQAAEERHYYDVDIPGTITLSIDMTPEHNRNVLLDPDGTIYLDLPLWLDSGNDHVEMRLFFGEEELVGFHLEEPDADGYHHEWPVFHTELDAEKNFRLELEFEIVGATCGVENPLEPCGYEIAFGPEYGWFQFPISESLEPAPEPEEGVIGSLQIGTGLFILGGALLLTLITAAVVYKVVL